jgi:hypothetical protein
VQNYCHTMDIMFLQEAGVEGLNWTFEDSYEKRECNDSFIIFSKEVFGTVNEGETNKWKALFNINGDTAVVVTSKGYLLVSAHFKSSAPTFNEQEDELMKVLNLTIDYYADESALKQPLKIIVGVDANHFLTKAKNIKAKTYQYPTKEQDFTTHKKRSYIQAQLKKADKDINEVKDHILTTCPIKEHYVSLINGCKSKN